VEFPVSKRAVPEVAAVEEVPDDTRPAWACPKCGEENPGNFSECWKCQTWRADEKRESNNPAATR
jgi:hypothetical protein